MDLRWALFSTLELVEVGGCAPDGQCALLERIQQRLRRQQRLPESAVTHRSDRRPLTMTHNHLEEPEAEIHILRRLRCLGHLRRGAPPHRRNHQQQRSAPHHVPAFLGRETPLIF